MATKASTSKMTAAGITETDADADASSSDQDQSGPSKDFVRRKEFVDRIVASSGMKPNAVKTALDAVLGEIGAALSKGEALNLPPLGKLSVNRRKDVKGGEILICKLRRSPPALKIDPALADAAE